MKVWQREDAIERELRGQRPEPRRELVTGIVGRVEARHAPARRPMRFGVAAVFSAAALVALAATGGLSYAASGVTHAATAAVHAVAPVTKAAPSGDLGSAAAQYKVAVCYHGATIEIDSHAAGVLIRDGARSGACTAGRFAPRARQQVMCLAGHNVWVVKKDVAKLQRLGFKKGFCKR